MPDYPRVLVVNAASIGGESSTGTTLANLFSGWPADRIAQIYCDSVPPIDSLCPRHFALSLADVPMDRFIRGILGGKEDRILGTRAPGLPISVVGTAEDPYRGLLRNIAGAWADMFSYKPNAALYRWIDDFHPEVIYSALGNGRLMSLVLTIARRYLLPIVPHFMDDWPMSLFRANILMCPPHLVMLSKLKNIFRLSVKGMTISEAMAEEYERRYKMKFEAFMNCVDVPSDCPSMPDYDSARSLVFVYVGGLHLNRWRALKEIGEAMEQLRSENLNIELVVYAPREDLNNYGELLKNTSALRLGGTLSAEEIPRALSAADVLIHVESFDPDVQQYTRFSLSTKVPQYMAMGRPILGYGPGDIASIEYIKRNNIGIVQDRPDKQELLKAIRQLASSEEQRRFWGRRGWEIAKEKHFNNRVREHFREVLYECFMQANLRN